jgi:FHS family L-fucose permease-like MFS transporter
MVSTTTTRSNQPMQEEKPVSNAGIALASLMTLFFMMGFITCLNDILIPYMKAIFKLNYAQANFINLCFFGAYFFMSIPSGMLINRIGYKKSMIAGFVIAAIGCFLFYPAAGSKIYGLFLAALFILASGITLLQVAGNPYVAALGPSSSSSARLTLTQAFNSVGTTIAPYFGSMLILSGLPKDVSIIENIDVSAVQKPYIWIGLLLIAIAAILMMLKLPVIQHGGKQQSSNTKKAWQYPHLVLGAIGIFCYVGAEVAIGSHIVNYLQLPEVMGMQADEAGKYVSYYWGGAMVGRFIGSWILSKFKPGNVLAFNALMAFVLVMISILSGGATAMWSLLAVGLFNSLMFATIFTLAVDGLDSQTDEGSGILCTAIVGGALIPFLYGITGDIFSLKTAYLLPAICYIYIIYYGFKGYKHS